MKANRKVLFKRLTRISYTLAVVFLLTGMILSAINQPVYARSQGQDAQPTEQVEPGDETGGNETGGDETGGDETGGDEEQTTEEATPTPEGGEVEDVLPVDETLVPTETPVPTATVEVLEEVTVLGPVLEFTGGCVGGNCTGATARVCNVGDAPTDGEVSVEVFFAASGLESERVSTGNTINVGALNPGDCAEVYTDATEGNGSYWFLLNQTVAGASVETWSGGCSITCVAPLFNESQYLTWAGHNGDVCYANPNPEIITVTVEVNGLPDGVTAEVQTNSYVVWPVAPDIDYSDWIPVQNGDSIDTSVEWPGLSGFVLGEVIVEVHWGAIIRINGEIGQGVGLDYYYNGYCDWSPTPTPTFTPTFTPTPTPLPDPIDISYTCTEDNMISWTISNPNDVDVPVSYQVDGGTPVVTSVPATSSISFVTSNGAHTVTGTYFDNQVDQPFQESSPSDYCVEFETEDLILTYDCVDGAIQWTVTNPNDYDIDFDWESLSTTASGSETVPAGGSVTIAITPVGSQTFRITWLDLNENEREITATNGDDYCRIIIVNTVTPTPEDPGGDPTPTPRTTLSTLPVPGTGSGGALIPVTGVDLAVKGQALSLLQQFFMNLGLVFLGIAFVLHSVTNKFNQ